MKDLINKANSLLGLHITKEQQSALEIYERELIEWNERYNLTAIDDPEQIRIKHFLDSLTCLLAMRSTITDTVIDVGTGAGFPGLVLSMVRPTWDVTLLESTGKKVNFLQHMIGTLALKPPFSSGPGWPGTAASTSSSGTGRA